MKNSNKNHPDHLPSTLYAKASEEVNKKVANDMKIPDPEMSTAASILEEEIELDKDADTK